MSNKTTTIIIVAIICIAFLAFLGVRFLSGEDNWICVDGQWVKHGFPAEKKPARECRNKTINDTNIDNREMEESQNKNKEAANNVDEDNIIIESPKAYDIIGLPVIIKGQARVFENTVSYRIKDSDGTVLLESYVTADSPDIGEFGQFEAEINYPEPKGEEGTIEVFEYSAKDGSEINKVKTPVVFKKVDAMIIKVFFGNRKEDPDAQNCSQVYGIERRVPKTKAVAGEAMKELLGGTNSQEQDEGYFSEINGNAKIKKIAIEGGVAKVDFSRELVDGISGSCEIEMIRAQIASTLKQFSTIQDVQITVDGQKGVL
jgi:hypothetical protein